MMRTLLGMLILSLSSVAWADHHKGHGPKPPPQMADYKPMLGKWRCKGHFNGMPGVPAHDYKAVVKFTKVLNGFWVRMAYKQKKSKKNPAPYEAIAMHGYDPKNKKYTSATLGNFGDFGHATSDNIKADVTVWTGEAFGMGKKMQTRATVTSKGKRTVEIKNEVKTPKGWAPIATETCKK